LVRHVELTGSIDHAFADITMSVARANVPQSSLPS
jgi:hypothetical protein